MRDLLDLIHRALADCKAFGPHPELDGKLSKKFAGLFHDNYCFTLRGDSSEQLYFLRLLQQGAGVPVDEGEARQGLQREAKTLMALRNVDFVFCTPKFICFVRDFDSETIGLIDPLVREIRQWIAAYVPTADSCHVLHGDLLPQNLMCGFSRGAVGFELTGIIDWKMARLGDPAYDLAIVSRGNRKVLGIPNGLSQLVDKYLEAGGQPVSVTDVRAHELLMNLGWLQEAWRDRRQGIKSGGQGPEFYEAQLRSLFQRTLHAA